MQLLKRVFVFYIDASIHVALSVIAMIGIIAILYGIQFPQAYYFTAFFGTIACYNFMKFGAEKEKYKILENRYLRTIQFFSVGGLILVIYYGLQLNMIYWIGFAICGVLTALYAIPVLPGMRNLRNFGLLKVIMVALVWMLVTVSIPLSAHADLSSWDLFLESIQCFLLITTLILPFEIRDMTVDEPRMRTLPQRLGIKRTKWAGTVLLLIYLLLLLPKSQVYEGEVGVKLSLALLVGIALGLTEIHRSRYFTAFWVEAIPIAVFAGLWVVTSFS